MDTWMKRQGRRHTTCRPIRKTCPCSAVQQGLWEKVFISSLSCMETLHKVTRTVVIFNVLTIRVRNMVAMQEITWPIIMTLCLGYRARFLGCGVSLQVL